MRDIKKRPYSADEKRVADYIVEVSGIGGGDDPIGFLIASHRALGMRPPVPAREFEGPQWQFWKPEDRFFHAADKTLWRFDPAQKRLVRAEAPDADGNAMAVLQIVNILLEDVAEKPERLKRAQEIAARDIPWALKL